MNDWSLEFDMSDAGAVVRPLLLILLLLSVRRFAAARMASRFFANLIAGATFLVSVGLLLALPRDYDKWPVALVAVMLLAGTWRRYAAPHGMASRRLRGLLSLARTIGILALLTLLARPVWTQHAMSYSRPGVLVLIDQSRSLQTRDAALKPDGPALRRAEAMTSAFAATAVARERLAQGCDILVNGFDTAVRPLKEWMTRADGPGTALATALDEASQRAVEPPAALVLISDGRETVGLRGQVLEAAGRWAGRNVPISTIGVGGNAAEADAQRIELTGMTAPIDARVGSEIAVDADVTAIGLAGGAIEVECRDDDEIVATRTLRPDKPRFTERLRFAPVGRTAGFHHIEIRARVSGAAKPASRGNPTNASSAALQPADARFVHVRDDRLKLLLVESHPRSETAFLARALAGDSRITCTTVLVARPAEGAWSNPLPRNVEQWQDFHVVLLGDLGRGEIARGSLDALAEAVTMHGVGLVALGGARRMDLFRSGPLAELSPTRLDASRPLLHDARATPTPAGLRHPLCHIAPSGKEHAAAWAALPNSPTACALGAGKPAAEVLLESDDGESLLAVMTAGRGRVAAIGLETTWRWAMQSDDGRAVHARFWRQLALWATQRQPAAMIRTDRSRYSLGALRAGQQHVGIEARLADPLTGDVPADARIKALLHEPLPTKKGAAPVQTEATPVTLTREGDHWVGDLVPHRLGEYTIELIARVGGPAAGQSATAQGGEAIRAAARFAVVDTDLELEQTDADFDLLRAMSAVTASDGGRFYTLNQLGDCLSDIAKSVKRRPLPTVARIDVCEQFGSSLLVLLCAMLLIEWSVRRRCGFV